MRKNGRSIGSIGGSSICTRFRWTEGCSPKAGDAVADANNNRYVRIVVERPDSTGGGQNGLQSGPTRSAARLQSMVRRFRGFEYTWRTRHDRAAGFALTAASFFRNTVKIVVELSRKLPLDLSNFLSWIRRIHLRSPSVVQAYKSQAARSRLHGMCQRFSSADVD